MGLGREEGCLAPTRPLPHPFKCKLTSQGPLSWLPGPVHRSLPQTRI